jgi:hypothetical protein
MKKASIYLSLGLVISCASIFPPKNTQKKEFEGIIRYKLTTLSKTQNVTSTFLQEIYGDTMTMFIKDGNYRMSYNGIDVQDIYYLTKENEEYTIRKNSDTLYFSPCDIENRPLISSESIDDEILVLNRKCRKIINTIGAIKDENWGVAKNIYWYDPELYINPEHFKDRKISYVNLYYDKAHSPWLKYEFEGAVFNLDYTAIQVEEKVLSQNLFDLPKLPRKRNP